MGGGFKLGGPSMAMGLSVISLSPLLQHQWQSLTRKQPHNRSLHVEPDDSCPRPRAGKLLSFRASAQLGIVITGGTKGLGYALAREFLAAGDRVVLCGRDEERLQVAIASLEAQYGNDVVSGCKCDVSRPDEVAAFGAFAAKRLGTIHVWLNNAGEVTSKRLLADIEAEEVVRVSNTNILGSLLCCREAVKLMAVQQSSPVPVYHIYNMGFSRWGARFTKSACTHKMTKVALPQLTESLQEELQNAGISSIGVHNLSPGMVLTDLLLKDSTPATRRLFNALAEEPETVAAELVPCIHSVQGSGRSINYLSPLSAFWKLLVGFPQIMQGGRFFDMDGNRLQVQGCHFQRNGVKILY